MTETKQTGLLVEGMKSYPKALGALNEFGRLVVSTIREVVIEDLDNLASAIGISLREDEVGDYVRPNRLAMSNPKDAVLGTRIDRIGQSGWGLYSYLYWSKGQPKLSVSIWLRDSTVAQSIVTAFKKLSPTTPVELDAGREVYISRALASDNPDQLPVVLRALV
jgi:hypothetical protein